MLELPPPYSELALREGHDAFVRATAEARHGAGAGLLVWTRRHGSVEAAVVLEPVESLAVARQVLCAGLAAVADALVAISPPEKPLELVWPDRVVFDGGLVGGGALSWPEGCAEGDVPEWLVFGFALRTELDQNDPNPATALIDEGFDDFENGPFVESFARNFLHALDAWNSEGPDSARRLWRQYGQDGDLAALSRAPSWLVAGEIAR
jgi:biotin-(acetyl-CoA carboxylase) ligase